MSATAVSVLASLPPEVSSACPIVRIEDAWIARRLKGQPAEAFSWGCLREQLLWLRQTCAQVLIMRGEEVLEEGGIRVDHAGLFESLHGPTNALQDAELTVRQPRVHGDPSLQVVVLFTVQDAPVRMNSGVEAVRWNRSGERHKRYHGVPDGWYYADSEILTRLLNLAEGQAPTTLPLHAEDLHSQLPADAPTMATASIPLTQELLEGRLRPIRTRESFPPAVVWRSTASAEENVRLTTLARERVAKATSALALPLPLTAG